MKRIVKKKIFLFINLKEKKECLCMIPWLFMYVLYDENKKNVFEGWISYFCDSMKRKMNTFIFLRFFRSMNGVLERNFW